MYQICLVIKEDLRTEVSSMLVSGHESLDEAAEQILVDFERLQDADELSQRIDITLKNWLSLTVEEMERALKIIIEG